MANEFDNIEFEKLTVSDIFKTLYTTNKESFVVDISDGAGNPCGLVMFVTDFNGELYDLCKTFSSTVLLESVATQDVIEDVVDTFNEFNNDKNNSLEVESETLE